ncbi:uncharacterized protein M6B38_298810 [Iris pallida]|uniref:DUF4378 domain-containing protein n=1 Tax=Iris pallida TaxID=29817 RepID=A0AAX6HQ15_IRIPA|nr:uncharacterized protein M6B38_298810 [Iris pallida]
MYHLSRSGDRRTAADSGPDGPVRFDPLSVDNRHRSKGDNQLRKQTKASKKALDSSKGNVAPLEENFIGLEFRSTSSKKASRAPTNALIDREISQEMEIRRSSPSLVARLMGLDSLPPSVAPYKHKERAHSCQKTPSFGFHEKNAANEGYSRWTNTDEYHKCKDVFEVRETLKVDKHTNQPIPKVKSLKQSEKDMDFTKQKLMDAKYLSTDDHYQQSKEHNETLEVLDSDEDHVLNFHEEPNMHLQDLMCSPPSPHANKITVLKPSKGTKNETSEIWQKSERYAQRRSHKKNGDISSSRKSETRPVNQSLKEHGQSLPFKLPNFQHTGKAKDLEPAQIVILKPSLEKAWGNAKTVPLARPSEDEFSLRRHKNVPISRTAEFYAEGKERQKLSDSVEDMGHKTRRSRKIARKVSEQMRNTGSSGRKEGSASKIYGYVRDGNSYCVSGMENLTSELFKSTSDQLNDCSDDLSTSSSTSTESLLNREARKHLSERLKTTHLFEEVGSIGRRSSTLGEMFASSDRETPRMALNKSIVQNLSRGKVARGEVPERWDFPLGISSKDGWMDGWSTNLPRSKSHPASSLVYRDHKPSRGNRFSGSDRSHIKNLNNISQCDAVDRNLQWRRTSSLKNFKYCHNDAQFYSGREECQMSEREIHVNSEELRDKIHGGHPGENVSVVREVCNSSLAGKGNASVVPELCNDSFVGRGQEPGNSSSQEFHLWESPPKIDGQQHKESSLLVKDVEFPRQDCNVSNVKETSMDPPQVDFLSYQGDVLNSSSILSSKEVDQPSPIPVLEPIPAEEDDSYDCFEKISSDLQELWTQLKLLKLESADTYTGDFDTLNSSEEDNVSLQKFGGILQSFRDDEERDYSYLLDLLLDSGAHDANEDGLLFACQSLEFSVGPEVFEKLEKKYSVMVSWSRSDRKLLFDLISSILVDVTIPSPNLHSAKPRGQLVWAREELVEKVWQTIVKRRKEVGGKQDAQILDRRWLDLVDDVDIVGKDLERMIIEDLMEEFYSQLASE